MKISQAIYTSENAELYRGYHLVSRSPDLDEQIAQSLCRWNPSHGCLSEAGTNAESLNFFQPLPDWHVLSRSVYGGPEFSQRGGFRVVTTNLVFHSRQMALLDNDVIACARIALSTGLLMLPLATPRNLPAVDFPLIRQHREISHFDSRTVEELIQNGRRLAIIGAEDPLAYLDAWFKNMPTHDRLQHSFATGLKPSAQRPFQIQFFGSVDTLLRQELIRQRFCVRNCPQHAAC